MILIALTALAPPDLASSPVYALAKTMVGGHWEGGLGGKPTVRFQFHLDETGLIVGDGLVSFGPKSSMKIRSTLGWDPIAKQVYYLDQHGADTVYFGHVTREGNALVFDFNGLVGDPGHYRSREELTPSEYVADMAEEKNGTWSPLEEHIRMRRMP